MCILQERNRCTSTLLKLMENEKRTAVSPNMENMSGSDLFDVEDVEQQSMIKEESSVMPVVPEEEEKWKRDNFEVRELLVERPHKEIYTVENKKTGELAFLEISRKHYQYKSKYLSEEYIWRIASSHPNIATLYSTYRINDSKSYVFEYSSNGNLRNFMKTHKVLQTTVAKLLTAQIASAVEFLHSKNIFHRDVSSRCILLNADGQAKLSGFTYAVMNKTSRGVHGNLYYQAPEVFSGEIYDMTADWYSLGVCLYEMVMGMTPAEYHCRHHGIRFKELDYTGKIVVMLTTSVYIPNIFPKNLKEMLEGLLQKFKENRFGYKENTEVIKNHPFFNGVDWDKLESGLLKVDLPSNERHSVHQIHPVLNK